LELASLLLRHLRLQHLNQATATDRVDHSAIHSGRLLR
jgi:hypothetical protein